MRKRRLSSVLYWVTYVACAWAVIFVVMFAMGTVLLLITDAV